jgi:type IV pilus assembly protein PilB
MMDMQRFRPIGQILIEAGALTMEHLTLLLEMQQQDDRRIGELALEKGWIDQPQLAKALAEQFHLQYRELHDFVPDAALLATLPADFASRFRAVPLHHSDLGLEVAVSDPTRVENLDAAELLSGSRLLLRVITEKRLTALLERIEAGRQMLCQVSEDLKLELVKETERGEELLATEKIGQDASPIIRLVDSTLLDALNKRASDIHIESGAEGVLVKYRVDGVLYDAADPLDMRFQEQIISRIKVMSELDIAERRIPQDGRFKIRLGDKSIDFRVSIMPSIHGEDAVIRILDKKSLAVDLKGLNLDILGMHEREAARLRQAIREPYGMLLVTGPTGSGKTTTLYAALSEINSKQEKIITIEDPVEYQLAGVVQVPVNEKKGLTFARGLRSILRHDPDKIMVGEIRDTETAQIAIQSALTGHLVFTTVHANNAFDVLGRFLHMGIDAHNFVSCLNCIAAQRLMRDLCPHCREEVRYSVAELAASGLSADFADKTFYRGGGCRECHGQGFRGRSAIVELLALTDDLREMILQKAPVRELKTAARQGGTTFLREAAVEKWLAGTTTLEEINRVTFVAQGAG